MTLGLSGRGVSGILILLVSVFFGRTLVNSDEVSTLHLPVVYVVFGDIPVYLRMNIELAARHNDVLIISDSLETSFDSKSRRRIAYEKMDQYMTSAKDFEPHYKHMSRDGSSGRKRHELRCFQRWYILRDYMVQKGLKKAFFGDGDSSVFRNISEVCQAGRSDCSAVINIETQGSNMKWTGAGEASVWSTEAIQDFCKFTQIMYQSKSLVLANKHRNGGSSVVDMSLLWLWWVAHFETPGWDTGRPWLSEKSSDKPADVENLRKRHDSAFSYAKKLDLASVDKSLKLCNGMDAVNRTVFDHFHPWANGGKRTFTLNLEGGGYPYFIGAVSIFGGKPESVIPEEVAKLEKERLYVVNSHYQGDSKRELPYDICRILTSTGDKYIGDVKVKEKCREELSKHSGCLTHHEHGVCF